MASIGKQKASSVAALIDLGFEESVALAALAVSTGDLQAAAALLMDGAFSTSSSGAPALEPTALVVPADALHVPIWADWLDGPFPAFELYGGEGGITFANVAAKGGAPVPCISAGDMLVAIDGSPTPEDVMKAAIKLQRSRGAHVNAGLETRLTIRSPSGAEWSLATGSGDRSGKLVSAHTIKKASASDMCGIILEDYGASVIISEVRPGGLADQAGLAVGIAIVSIGGTAIVPPNDKVQGVTGHHHATSLLKSLEGAIEIKGDLSVWQDVTGLRAAGDTTADTLTHHLDQPNSCIRTPRMGLATPIARAPAAHGKRGRVEVRRRQEIARPARRLGG